MCTRLLTFEGYGFGYVIPKDVAVPRYMARESRLVQPAPYRMLREYGGEKRLLVFTDASPAVMVGSVIDASDPTAWTPMFIESLTWKLGHLFCPMLGIAVERMSYANKRADETLIIAQVGAANSEANHELLIPPEWISAR